jgi:hypothetical protein
MFIDIMWASGAIIGMVGALLDSRYLAAFVWFGIFVYALLNFSERRLKGSKYDY